MKRWIHGLTCLLLLSQLPLQAVEVGSAEAMRLALQDEPTRDRLESCPTLDARVRFLDPWNCWMVEWFCEDRRIAFVTLSPEGRILERGPNQRSEPQEPTKEEDLADRRHALLEALELARAAGNEPEQDEILQLLENLERTDGVSMARVDPAKWLEEARIIGSYDLVALRWSAIERKVPFQVHVERQQGDAWQDLGFLSLEKGVWMDPDVLPGETTVYRLRCQQADGSWMSQRILQATASELQEASLPTYHLELDATAWARMLDEPTLDIEASGTFLWQGSHWPMKLRLRGASTRHALKKSFRVSFPETSPMADSVVYFKAEPMDHTLQQEKLSHDVFQAEGHPCSQVQYVNLTLNGVYQGVYLQVEPIRTPFKARAGLDPRGHLIRAATFGDPGQPGLGDPRGSRDEEALEALEGFLRGAWNEPDASFADWIHQHMDWPRVCDYLALQTLCQRSEIESNDYFFYQDPETGQWSFIPWDHNNGNFAVLAYQNRLHEPHISIFPQTVLSAGWKVSYSYVLHSRIFRDPILRASYLRRLEGLVSTWVMQGRLADHIAQNTAQLQADFPRDPYRHPFLGEDPFLTSGERMKTWVQEHGKRLLEQIQEARETNPQPLLTFTGWEANAARLRWKQDKGLNPGQDSLALGLRTGEITRQIPMASLNPSLREGHWEVSVPMDRRHGGLAALLRTHAEGNRTAPRDDDDGDRDCDPDRLLDFCYLPFP